ncbi:predicted protein [Pyrenophora tritici-repentis Pt-1C-BFP]|uniref:Uncharacterized protein n=1 Tax=Pyrenophora tritici-repentis (strain Pt-1C-BFP) TaxID=426418 RepID=B2VUS6_PYRTR|nr:uncharacterized protein PTRG_01063 [Pyrenophora tritici-repentis Pt-1C-BFP]EDU40501.1 predicted protein [Pyrenophora tritici-repentis Pt-1C-BFP]
MVYIRVGGGRAPYLVVLSENCMAERSGLSSGILKKPSNHNRDEAMPGTRR